MKTGGKKLELSEFAEREFNAFLKRRGIMYYCACGLNRKGELEKCPECEHFEQEFKKEKLVREIIDSGDYDE